MQGVRKSWIFSYILIFFIPFLALIIVYSIFNISAQDDNKSRNLENLSMIHNAIDAEISNIYSIHTRMSTSKNFIDICKYNDKGQDLGFELYEISNDLSLYENYNAFSVFIYYPKIDMVVSNKSIVSTEIFRASYFPELTNENFLNKINEANSKKYTNIISKNLDYSTMIMPFLNKNDAFAIFLFNKEFISSNITKNKFTNLGNLIIYDRTQGVFFSNSDAYEEILQNRGVFNLSLENINGNLVYIKNYVSNNLNYVFVIPKTVFLGQLSIVQKIMFVLFMAIILLGFFVIKRIIRINYRPFEQLFEKLGGKVTENEFSDINNIINTIEFENEGLKEILEKSNPIIKDAVLSNLLFGKKIPQDEILRSIGFQNLNSMFLVLACSIEDYGIFSKWAETENAKFIISNVLTELLNENNTCFVTEENKNLIFIVELLCKDIKEIYNCIEKGTEFIEKNFEVKFSLGLSDVRRSVKTLDVSFLQATEALLYKKQISKQNFVEYQNIVRPKLDIRAYINENYDNPSINIPMIADYFGYATTYVSKVFKDTYGEVLIDYIAKLRIERAKTLLLTTKETVDKIALNVGFTNKVTFIRTFKKLCNTTPGEFRNINLEKNS